MFHNIPPAMKQKMEQLEAIDAKDRIDGTPQAQRLRQIPPETGRLLALLAANAPSGDIIEIGTSAGYSTLWLALACVRSGRQITTFEVHKYKADLAAETFRVAQVQNLVKLVTGDARDRLGRFEAVAFCFLDAEKDIYLDCYEAVIPKMVDGGLLVADNAINHRATLQPTIDRALSDTRVDAVVDPIGSGLLICRRYSDS